ncbi:MAG: PqqD family peptide modification chaperone [Brevefilum sp.]
MTDIVQSIKEFFSKKEPLPRGMYRYQSPQDAEDQYRLHLRIDEDGEGILVINAATVLHLNQTAVEFAYHLIKQTDREETIQQIAKRYRVNEHQIRQDFEEFLDKVQTLIHTPDLDPVTYLDIERQEPYRGKITAPYRLDCALTYRVGEHSRHEHAPVDRVDRELTMQEWVSIFHKAYNNGIPHLLFTGGEPTLREDLPDLVLKAEELGLVTGLLTYGLKLGDDEYRNRLLNNGLDHVMILFDPNKPELWKILEKILAEDLFTTVHLTLEEGENLTPQIKRLAEMGTNGLSLSEVDKSMTDNLQELRDFAAMQGLNLVWDMPVPYSSNNPVSLELEKAEDQEPPEGAGKAWLYVEPDGDVLPAQGIYNKILGNLLTDDWEDIWEKR